MVIVINTDTDTMLLLLSLYLYYILPSLNTYLALSLCHWVLHSIIAWNYELCVFMYASGSPEYESKALKFALSTRPWHCSENDCRCDYPSLFNREPYQKNILGLKWCPNMNVKWHHRQNLFLVLYSTKNLDKRREFRESNAPRYELTQRGRSPR